MFGEALGSLYADKYGMEMFMMRIGNVNPMPIDKRRLSIWFSPRDLAQLVSIGIDQPDIKFEIVYGISGNKRAWYDNSNAERLGYRPQDDSEVFAQEILRTEKPSSDAIAETHQGGIFCTAEDVPNPAAPQEEGRRRRERRNEAQGARRARCDTHMHFYDGAASAAPGTPNPGNFTVPMYRELQRRLGLERVIVVQPNAYRDDNTRDARVR